MATPTFDGTRFYQVAQDASSVYYYVQDNNWYKATTLVSLSAAVANYKIVGVGPANAGTFTYATLPPAASFAAGVPVYTTDRGPYYSNGTSWVADGPNVIAQSGLPLMIVPTGSAVSAVGAVTLSTTLPIATGSCYGYLPANYLSSSSAAGWYYGTISDTTHVTFYNNTWAGTGVPTIPASPTAFAALSGGTPTGATGARTVTFAVPAGAMGPNGELEIKYTASFNSSGNNKVISVAFGSLSGPTTTATTTTSLGVQYSVRNSGQTGVQICALTNDEAYSAATQALGYGAVDTTAAVNVVITINNANAADFLILNSYSLKLFPS